MNYKERIEKLEYKIKELEKQSIVTFGDDEISYVSFVSFYKWYVENNKKD